MRPPPPAQARERADLVFTGKAVSKRIEQRRKGPGGSHKVYAFEIDRVFKGQPGAKTDVYTAMDSAMCGREYEIGEQYLVYARNADGEVRDNLCSRTQKLADAKADLAVFGSARKPKTEGTDPANGSASDSAGAAPGEAGAPGQPEPPARPDEPTPPQPTKGAGDPSGVDAQDDAQAPDETVNRPTPASKPTSKPGDAASSSQTSRCSVGDSADAMWLSLLGLWGLGRRLRRTSGRSRHEADV